MSLKTRLLGSPLYDLLLRVKTPDGLLASISDPWPGEPAEADRMFQGRYRFSGEEVSVGSNAPWLGPGRSASWSAALHDFTWLRHFEAAGGDAARRHVRALVLSWITRFNHWHPLAWRSDITGRRIVNWISHAQLLQERAEEGFSAAFLRSLARQARHLHFTLDDAAAGPPRLIALIGAVYATLALPGETGRQAKAMQALAREVQRQVLADGGHISRNPSVQHAVLRDLIALRLALSQAQVAVPEWLQHAIDRMAPMLRFFRHGDGGLALFHGSEEDVGAALDHTLATADSRGRPLDSATFTGYERLASRKSFLIADAGQPPLAASGSMPHASPLAFEFSHGRDRLVVNCGMAQRQERSQWAAALSSSPAHSTLTFSDANAFDLANPDNASVLAVRDEQDGAIWLDLSHEGYRRRFGLVHRRRLYLAATGDDLRGQDSLEGPGLEAAGGKRFAIRFHLHPTAQASILGNGATVLVKAGSGLGWQFRASGGAIAVEDSVYFGRGREQRRNQQIVVAGMISSAEPVLVKWAFSRVGG